MSCEKNCDKYQVLQGFIDEHKDEKGVLISVLHKAQEIFGCLNEDVQRFVADGLNTSMADVYGVATFYSQFSLKPKGKYIIGVCMGTTCYIKHAQDIINEITDELGIKVGETTADGKFTLEGPRCIGCCGLAPVVSVNEDVYGNLNVGEMTEIIKKYK